MNERAKWRNLKLLVWTAALALIWSEGFAAVDVEDSAEIINTLVALPDAKYVTEQPDGTTTYNALAAYQGWGNLYDKYAQLETANEEFSAEYLRVYLLMGLIAQLSNQAGTSEAFSSDMMSLYQGHKSSVLAALNELPYLAPSTCYYLGNYFGFEDKNADKLECFLKQHGPEILQLLGEGSGAQCIESIKTPTAIVVTGSETKIP